MTGVEILPFAVVAACLGIAVVISYVAMKNWKGDRYLCTDCVFNEDDLCKKSARPLALECKAYQPGAVPPPSLAELHADSNVLVVKPNEADA